MGYRPPYVIKSPTFKDPLDYVPTVQPFVNRPGINIPEQPLRKTLDELAHFNDVEAPYLYNYSRLRRQKPPQTAVRETYISASFLRRA